MDEAQQQRKDRAARLIDKLASTDLYAKQCMAFMLIGMKMVHYGVSRLHAHLADKTAIAQDREDAVEVAMERMRDMSMRGFQSQVLVGNLRELDKILCEDLKKEKARDEQLRDKELRLGIPTPFEELNRKLGGGMKAGKVVLVHGEAAPVFTALAGMYRHFIKQKVPITHFGTVTQDKMPEVPGVKNIPGAFWRGQGSSLNRMKGVFEVAEGYVFILDRLDWLMSHEDRHKPEAKRRQMALKYIAKMAKRYKAGVVVGHVTASEDLPTAQNTFRLPVCARKLGAKPIFMAGDEMFTEESDGGLRVLGRENVPEEGLGGSDGGPEGSQQLEGSGEDRGEGSRVEGDSGGEEYRVPDGEIGGRMGASERQGQGGGRGEGPAEPDRSSGEA